MQTLTLTLLLRVKTLHLGSWMGLDDTFNQVRESEACGQLRLKDACLDQLWEQAACLEP